MDINFDCIKSLIESKVNSFIEIKGFTYKNNGYLNYECVIYNKLVIFQVKEKSNNINKNKCIDFCNIIDKDNLTTTMNLYPNLLKNILNDYDKCIIENNLKGCKFYKDDCFKNIG